VVHAITPLFQRGDAPSRGPCRIQGSTEQTALRFIHQYVIYTRPTSAHCEGLCGQDWFGRGDQSVSTDGDGDRSRDHCAGYDARYLEWTESSVSLGRVLYVSPKFRPKFRGFKTRLTCVKGRPALALPADESPAIAL
jgi:hypothetical protein